jgi:hypothetical protein
MIWNEFNKEKNYFKNVVCNYILITNDIFKLQILIKNNKFSSSENIQKHSLNIIINILI